MKILWNKDKGSSSFDLKTVDEVENNVEHQEEEHYDVERAERSIFSRMRCSLSSTSSFRDVDEEDQTSNTTASSSSSHNSESSICSSDATHERDGGTTKPEKANATPKSVRFNTDLNEVFHEGPSTEPGTGQQPDSSQSCLYSRQSSWKHRWYTNILKAKKKRTPSPEREYDPDSACIWYSQEELARMDAQLEPDTCTYLIEDMPRAARCLRNLRLLYRECHKSCDEEHEEVQSGEGLKHLSTESTPNYRRCQSHHELLRDNLRQHVYANEGDLDDDKATDRINGDDMPLVCEQSKRTTIVGLERIVMGPEQFEKEAHNDRLRILRQQQQPKQRHWNSRGKLLRRMTGREQEPFTSVSQASRASSRFAQELAGALAASLYPEKGSSKEESLDAT